MRNTLAIIYTVKKDSLALAVVAHAFNSSTQEAEAGRPLSSRIAREVILRNPVSKKERKKDKEKREKKKSRKGSIKKKEKTDFVIHPDYRFEEEDHLIMMGNNDDVFEILKRMDEKR